MCVFLYSMKEKGSDWHYMATPGEEGQRAGLNICLSKATTQVPVPASSSGHTLKQQET